MPDAPFCNELLVGKIAERSVQRIIQISKRNEPEKWRWAKWGFKDGCGKNVIIRSVPVQQYSYEDLYHELAKFYHIDEGTDPDRYLRLAIRREGDAAFRDHERQEREALSGQNSGTVV